MGNQIGLPDGTVENGQPCMSTKYRKLARLFNKTILLFYIFSIYLFYIRAPLQGTNICKYSTKFSMALQKIFKLFLIKLSKMCQ